MILFSLLASLIGCAAASSEEGGFPLQEELRAPTLSFGSDAANNSASTANEGLTVLRRMTTGAEVVTTEDQFRTALKNNTVISLRISLIEITVAAAIMAGININGITGLVINGNKNKVDGGGNVQCFSITNGAEVSFNDLTIMNCKSNASGGGVWIHDSTATFTSCSFTSNEAAKNGGAIALSRGTLNLIGYSFSGNTAPNWKDIFQNSVDTTLNLYSLCSGNSFSGPGTESLDCAGCSGSPPTNLSDTSLCIPCDGTSSCCGATDATACSASEPICSAAEQEICNWSPIDDLTPALAPGGTCFHGATQVTFEDETTKAMTELQVGDKIQTADIYGNLDFAPIISMPHKAGNNEMVTFLKIVTDSGKSVQMTPGHLIPNCAGKMFSANEVAVGDCVMTVDGKEVVFEITSATHFGVYTAVTAHALIVANGIIASPFSVENDPHNHNDGISSSFAYFINKMSAKVSSGLRGAKEPSNFKT